MWQVQKWRLTGPLGFSLESVVSVHDSESDAIKRAEGLNSTKRYITIEYRVVLVD